MSLSHCESFDFWPGRTRTRRLDNASDSWERVGGVAFLTNPTARAQRSQVNNRNRDFYDLALGAAFVSHSESSVRSSGYVQLALKSGKGSSRVVLCVKAAALSQALSRNTQDTFQCL